MKEPLVLLPGMMCDARLFAPQLNALSYQRPMVVMPLVGDNTMQGLARNVLNHTPPQFALAGLSMGGIVAMEIIRQAPDRVTRLALMDTNPLADPAENSAIREKQVDQVRRGGLAEVMRDQMKPNYLAESPDKTAILDVCMEMAEALGAEVFQDQSHAVQHRPDQCETLRAINIPTLVLCGEEERLCPVSRHEMMKQLISNSRLVVIPRAGHLPTLEQPNATNKALSEWLTQ